MCLAVPALVEEVLEDSRARVRLGGVSQEISTVLIEELRKGDYVIVHVGFALGRLDREEAQKTLNLIREAAGSEGGD
ncbi:MAG: HypC/HybG/HupF family hydrogenase formation chaperone [Nitrospirae bacterium]|jgi:hydrogenase expression/formation protein HypC|nr:HypC/HybG/HupF family hydrogenase formation chaperone [Nitrospirota bacterium]